VQCWQLFSSQIHSHSRAVSHTSCACLPSQLSQAKPLLPHRTHAPCAPPPAAADLVPKLKPCPLATCAQLCTCLTKLIAERCNQRRRVGGRALVQRLDGLAVEALLLQPILHQLMVAALAARDRHGPLPLVEEASVSVGTAGAGGPGEADQAAGLHEAPVQQEAVVAGDEEGRQEEVPPPPHVQFIRAAAAAAENTGTALHVSAGLLKAVAWAPAWRQQLAVSLLLLPGGLCAVYSPASAYAVHAAAVPRFLHHPAAEHQLKRTTPRLYTPQDAAYLVLRVRVRRSQGRRVLACFMATRSPRDSDLHQATLELQASCRRMTELRTLLWTEVAALEPPLGSGTSLLGMQMQMLMQRGGFNYCQRLGSMASAAEAAGCAARGLVTSHSMLRMHSGVSGLMRGFSARSEVSEAAVASAAGLDVLQEIEPEVWWEMLNCGEFAVWGVPLC
jgi:hypothetical protein